tara:strand:- start:138 stop:404 length:267 start_codon:yes stop_codon:yes gene_type:complete
MLRGMRMRTVASTKRSGVKALTWRGLATLDTFLIAWFITGEALIGLSIISIEVATKFFLYYFHERAWSKTEWGKVSEMTVPDDWELRI